MVGPKSNLWQRISEFPIDEADAELTFTARLARENGWSMVFAQRVVEEYKRFLFLAMAAGHEVTPSDEVDQAWHLHLVYTRSYWDELCSQVLGRPLHHGPTRGGRDEGARYDENYERTLASYEHWFGERPPTDIWPPSHIRFGDGAQFSRVNTARNWIVNKRAIRNAVAAVGIVCLSVAGLGAAARPAADRGEWYDVITIGTVVFGFVMLIFAIVRRLKDRSGGRGESGCGGGWFFWGCSGCGSDGGSGCSGSGCGGGGGCGGGD